MTKQKDRKSQTSVASRIYVPSESQCAEQRVTCVVISYVLALCVSPATTKMSVSALISAILSFALFASCKFVLMFRIMYVCRTMKVDPENRDAGETMGKTRRKMPDAGLRPVLIHKTKLFNYPAAPKTKKTQQHKRFFYAIGTADPGTGRDGGYFFTKPELKKIAKETSIHGIQVWLEHGDASREAIGEVVYSWLDSKCGLMVILRFDNDTIRSRVILEWIKNGLFGGISLGYNADVRCVLRIAHLYFCWLNCM